VKQRIRLSLSFFIWTNVLGSSLAMSQNFSETGVTPLAKSQLGLYESNSRFNPKQIRSQQNRPWVFFDLGKTLIDHGNYNPETASYEEIRYMPGAFEHLIAVKSAGFHIGLITDIPESFGSTNEEKITSLKSFIKRGWVENGAPGDSFDWSIIDHILVPQTDSERKRSNNPIMFFRARMLASPCGMIFQGENPREIELAKFTGSAAKKITELPSDYIPANQIESVIRLQFGQACL
jgi:hypothetical protein